MSEYFNSDLNNLKVLRVENYSNLNINSLVEKMNHLREIRKESPTNILYVDDTKLDFSYPDAQLQINDY